MTLTLFLIRILMLVLLYGFLLVLAWGVYQDLRRGDMALAAQRQQRPKTRLVVVASGDSGYAVGQGFPLGTITTIGRDYSNDIALSDSYASAKHARIDHESDGRFWLVDVGSSNGTMLNGQQIRPNVPVPLDGGDMIRIGKVELRVS
ncbi:MAG: FHA domain-containing protein [Anaerolineales bacterium]|nr:FHA domain-containing protein [Anaerolineales bacterium]MCB9129134.1 FHA domain-containing protein [Ardenticatenales bacterium]MCB9171630.1 FHA domain-containing protein [Ardenticatenales bacterium]